MFIICAIRNSPEIFWSIPISHYAVSSQRRNHSKKYKNFKLKDSSRSAIKSSVINRLKFNAGRYAKKRCKRYTQMHVTFPHNRSPCWLEMAGMLAPRLTFRCVASTRPACQMCQTSTTATTLDLSFGSVCKS